MLDLPLEIPRTETSRIRAGRGAFARLGEWMAEALAPRGPGSRVALVSDRDVASFCLEPALKSLRAAGFDPRPILIPPGEGSKSLRILGNVWDRMLAHGLDRGSAVVALGGGVVGDLAGFAAATLMRGVALVQVPTSLVAQVDSAIGGKNGIDRPVGKNLVGTFLQPRLVVIDPELLATLPEREFRCGLAEVAKYGFLRDPRILERLHRAGDLESLRGQADVVDELVERCVRIKVGIVGRDAREEGERTLLNFGHTTAHALEAAEGFAGLGHGEAVAIGMVAAAFLGVAVGVSSATLPAEITEVLELFGLPTTTPVPPDQLLPLLTSDKKRRGGRSRWVLVKRAGEAIVLEDPPAAQVRAALAAVHAPVTSSGAAASE